MTLPLIELIGFVCLTARKASLLWKVSFFVQLIDRSSSVKELIEFESVAQRGDPYVDILCCSSSDGR